MSMVHVLSDSSKVEQSAQLGHDITHHYGLQFRWRKSHQPGKRETAATGNGWFLDAVVDMIWLKYATCVGQHPVWTNKHTDRSTKIMHKHHSSLTGQMTIKLFQHPSVYSQMSREQVMTAGSRDGFESDKQTRTISGLIKVFASFYHDLLTFLRWHLSHTRHLPFRTWAAQDKQISRSLKWWFPCVFRSWHEFPSW